MDDFPFHSGGTNVLNLSLKQPVRAESRADLNQREARLAAAIEPGVMPETKFANKAAADTAVAPAMNFLAAADEQPAFAGELIAVAKDLAVRVLSGQAPVAELIAMLDSHQHGRVADCRIIEVLNRETPAEAIEG